MDKTTKDKLNAVIIDKLLWVVNLLPGEVVLNNPGEAIDAIFWNPDGQEMKGGAIEAKVCLIVSNREKSYVLVVRFSFPSGVVQDGNNVSAIKSMKIKASLGHYPKEGQEAVVIITSQIKTMDQYLSHLDKE